MYCIEQGNAKSITHISTKPSSLQPTRTFHRPRLSKLQNSSRNGAKELESVQSQVSASNLEANLKLMTLASNVLAPPHRLLVTIEARVHALLRKKHVGMQEDER